MSTARQNNSPSKEEGRKDKAVKEEDNSVKEESSEVSSDEGTSGQSINQDLTDLSEMILMCGTSLETDTLNLTTQYHKDLVRFKEMLEERENHHVQAERCISSLKSALDEKEEELRIVAQEHQMSEASLEASMRYRNDLEEEKAQLFKDLVELRGKLEKSEDQRVQAEGCIKSLESSLDEKEKELKIVAEKYQMSESSLEASMRYHNDLEKEKARILKDLVELRGKLEKSEDQHVQAEGRIKSLESSLDEKEEELRIVVQKHQISEASLVELRGKLEKSEDQHVQAEGCIKSLESSLDEKEEELRIVAQKHQMTKDSLEASIRYHNDLEEEKARILKDLVELRGKLEKSEDQHVQAEGRIKSLESSLDEKEQELRIVVQKHQMSEASLVELRGKLEKSEDQHVQAEGRIKSLESSLDEKEEELRIVAQKHQMTKASLEASIRHHNDLEEEKARIFEDLVELRGKLEKSEDQHVQAEGRIKSLESSLDKKEEELRIVVQKHRMSEASLVELRGKLEKSEDQHVQAEGCIKSLESSLDEKEEELKIVAQKHQMTKDSLEASIRYHNDLEEEKAQIFKDLVELRGKLEKSEDQHVQAEGRIKSLESSLDAKEEELRIVVQKHQMSEASLEGCIKSLESSLDEKKEELRIVAQKNQMSEASLEASMRYHNDMEEEKARLLKDLVELRGKLEKSEDQHVQAEGRIKSLESSLDEKVEELRIVVQKHQMSEASLEASMRYHNDMEEEKALLLKDLDELRGKLEKSEDQQTFNTAEGHIKSLESSLDEKEEVLRIIALEEEKARLFKDLVELRGKLEKSEDQRVQAEGCIKSLESSLDEKEEELRLVAQKHKMSNVSLKANMHNRHDLEEEKAWLFKDLVELRGKLEKSEDQQTEGRIKSLKNSLDEKEKEPSITQKHQMSKASLEANMRYRNDLEEEKDLLLVELRRKLEKSQDQHALAEGRIKSLKRSLDEKELSIVTQKHQGAAELEEAVQRLKIENARLKAAAKQQSNKSYALQKGAQELAMDRGWLENMAANPKSSKITFEQLSQEVQKQVLKSCSQVGLRLEQHEKENTEIETEKKKAERIAEQKRLVDGWLDEEMKKNTELKIENYMLRSSLKTAKKKLRDQDAGRRSQADSAFRQMKKKVDNLQEQLQKEWSRCSQLEKVNSDLKDQLTSFDTMSHLNDQLKRSKRQLEEEVRCLTEAAQMEHSQMELNIERRANQTLQQKLEEINISLQSQAVSNIAFDKIKAANEAKLRFELEQKIQDLEGKLDSVTTTYHDNMNRRDSICTELERYRQLYTDEMHLRKSLAAKLERANSRLEDASYKVHNQLNSSLITCNIPDRNLGGPLLNVELFGLTGAPPQEPLPGTLSLHSSVNNRQSNRVEDYHTEMQRKWDRNTIIHHSCSTAYSFRGCGGLEPIPAALGEGGVHPGQVASPSQLDRNTSKELNNATV